MATTKILVNETVNTAFSNAIIDSLPGIFYIYDHNGKFLKWNKHFEKAIGYNTTELIKKQPLAFFKTQAKNHIDTQQKRRHQTENVDTITSKNGKKTQYHFTVNTITYNEQHCIAVNGIDITQQIEDQRQLTLSQNTLDGLFNSAPLGMAILSITRRWIKVNNKLCTMLGYSEKEMLSMSYDDIADPIHKKDNEQTYRKFEKKLIDSYTTERIFIKKDGTQVWVNLTMALIEDRVGVPIYYISQLEDITEKKKTLKELSDYKIALDESSIVAITDPKCIINYVNSNFCKISGYDSEELQGQGHGLINSTYNPKKFVKQLLENITKGEIWRGDLCDMAKDGKLYWIETTIVPFLNEKGKPLQYVVIGSDITSRKNTEEQREKMLEDIVQRNKDLEQFTYIVSHNLRGPLANIIGFTDELKLDENSAEKKVIFLDYLSVSVGKMDEVVNDLNTILQVKHTSHEIKEAVSLATVLSDTETMLSNIINNQNIKITANFSAVDEIQSIKSYIYSIFYNLISNSIKYSRADIKTHIEISSKKNAGCIMLKFKDNGMGIDAKQLEELFGLYKRFHTSVAEGKGIGLYITKTQIESIGGYIKVKSKVNSGTEFNIQLPL